MVMQRWDPFSEMLSLRSAMDRLFEDTFGGARAGLGSSNNVGGFPIDIYEQGDELRIKASMPGIKPEDIKISVENNTVSIEGESRQDFGDGTARHQEHRYGKVMRSVTLPANVDASKAAANFEHGVLTLTLPRSESARVREIPVTQGAGKQAIPAQAGTKPTTNGSSGSSSQTTAEKTTKDAVMSTPKGPDNSDGNAKR